MIYIYISLDISERLFFCNLFRQNLRMSTPSGRVLPAFQCNVLPACGQKKGPQGSQGHVAYQAKVRPMGRTRASSRKRIRNWDLSDFFGGLKALFLVVFAGFWMNLNTFQESPLTNQPVGLHTKAWRQKGGCRIAYESEWHGRQAGLPPQSLKEKGAIFPSKFFSRERLSEGFF